MVNFMLCIFYHNLKKLFFKGSVLGIPSQTQSPGPSAPQQLPGSALGVMYVPAHTAPRTGGSPSTRLDGLGEWGGWSCPIFPPGSLSLQPFKPEGRDRSEISSLAGHKPFKSVPKPQWEGHTVPCSLAPRILTVTFLPRSAPRGLGVTTRSP